MFLMVCQRFLIVYSSWDSECRKCLDLSLRVWYCFFCFFFVCAKPCSMLIENTNGVHNDSHYLYYSAHPPRLCGETPPLIQDRKYHLTTYKTCFVGSQLVDWLVQKGEASGREEAVQLGRELLDAGMLAHGEALGWGGG